MDAQGHRDPRFGDRGIAVPASDHDEARVLGELDDGTILVELQGPSAQVCRLTPDGRLMSEYDVNGVRRGPRLHPSAVRPVQHEMLYGQ